MDIEKTFKISDLEDDIARTLFLPLAMKSRDYQKKDSILNDKYSFDIASKISDIDTIPTPRGSFVGTNLRSKYIDNECIKYAQALHKPIIVILGCGLDTRHLRIKNRVGNAEFFELDLPEVIQIRKELFPEEKNLIPSSMFETDWMDDLKSKYQDSEFIFVIEGVLMYFSEKDIMALFHNLEKRFKGILIADMSNKWMVRNQKRHDLLKNNNAKLLGGFDDFKVLETDKIKLVHAVPVLSIESHRYGFMRFLTMIFKNLKNSLKITTFSINKS